MRLEKHMIDTAIDNRKRVLELSQEYLYAMTDKASWHTCEYDVPFNGDIDIPNGYAVYVIEADKNPSDIAELFRNKGSIGYSHYSKYNSKYNENESGVLYVGSSQHLKSRIKQHIGVPCIDENKNRQTYSLWLNDWFRGRIKVRYYTFEAELEQANLQVIEDVIWDIKQPQFGKQGGK